MHTASQHRSYPFPVYPILIGVYPVLYLWSANRIQQPAYVVVPSLAVTLLALILFYAAAAVLMRSVHRAALSTAAVSVICLAYGHVLTLSRQWGMGLQHRYMLPAAGLLIAVALVWIQIRRFDYAPLTRILNLVSAVLVLFPLVTAGAYYLPAAQRSAKAARAASAAAPAAAPAAPSGSRDIYFIILDNYGRQDHLLEQESFDNSLFVAELKKRGFQFPNCAQGNYPGTAPVIASILNMDYLDRFGLSETDFLNKKRYSVLAPYIQDSLVLEKFRSYGYHVVTFRGFMDVIDIQNADTYISFDKDESYQDRLETYNFQTLYFQTTIFHPINEKFQIYPEWLAKYGPAFLAPYLPHQELLEERFLKIYEQNIYAFDALERIPDETPGPRFVYAHLYSTHWPYMLRPDGRMRLPFSESTATPGYLDGVRYTNERILQVIDSLLDRSEVKPVIIIQGDHANGYEPGLDWSGKARLQILSAFYLPEGGEPLPETISPVNTFRMVFNRYFGEPIDLLPDMHYYLDNASGKLKLAPESCIPADLNP